MELKTEKQPQISGWHELAAAVVAQAVIEMARGMRKLDKDPTDTRAMRLVGEAKAFIMSEDFTIYTDMDAKKLLTLIEKNYKTIKNRKKL